MGRRLLALLAVAVAAPVVASFNQDAVPLSDEQVLQLVSKDDRMTVPVHIGGGGPWPFIIDTGAQRTVISRELANVLKLRRGRDVTLTAMTSTSRVSTAVIPSIRVSTINGEQIEAPALAARHLGAPGLLGIDTLQGKKVSIDFKAQTMTVNPSAKRPVGKLPPRRADEIVVTARNYLGQLVVTDAFYRGRPIRVVIDTGAAVSIGNDAFHRLAGKYGTRPLEMTSVVGEMLKAEYKTIGDVTFGGVVIRNLPVAFADATPFRQFKLDKKPALLLGMDALALFARVDIDFPNREVRLQKPRTVELRPVTSVST